MAAYINTKYQQIFVNCRIYNKLADKYIYIYIYSTIDLNVSDVQASLVDVTLKMHFIPLL